MIKADVAKDLSRKSCGWSCRGPRRRRDADHRKDTWRKDESSSHSACRWTEPDICISIPLTTTTIAA